MNKIRKAGIKLGGLLTCFVLFLGVASSGPICFFLYHQPKVPEGMSKFSRTR